MEVTGKVKKVFETQTFDSGFRKRELVVTTEEQYPQHISIEFHQDKVDLLNDLIEGYKVKVSINLRGREWTNPEGVTRYFNTIAGWRLEKQADAPTANQVNEAIQDSNNGSKGEDFDDLPF